VFDILFVFQKLCFFGQFGLSLCWLKQMIYRNPRGIEDRQNGRMVLSFPRYLEFDLFFNQKSRAFAVVGLIGIDNRFRYFIFGAWFVLGYIDKTRIVFRRLIIFFIGKIRMSTFFNWVGSTIRELIC
jgi:hypothetical protein